MDTEYIKQCEKAVEIQELKAGHVMQSVSWDTHIDPVSGVWLTARGEYYTGYRLGLQDEQIIWLPTQSQLQAMLPLEARSYLGPIKDFAFANQEAFGDVRRNIFVFGTMEQLWLAFVMADKFGKRWDGNDWVDARE